LYVVNPAPPYVARAAIPYYAYDAVNLKQCVRAHAISQYIRSSSQDICIDSDKYLLPGRGVFNITACLPEMYGVVIDQGYPTLPKYFILVGWLNPLEVVEADGTILHSYGVFGDGETIVFKYKTAVFRDKSLLGILEPNSAITLRAGSTYTLIPLEGPYRGNVFHIWVNSWRIIYRS